ncbi:MAG TPA: hypothetical protein VNY81_05630 [Candidatus Saccharimonadales bacterium]|jgi:hypothetical protein|nr:hypothetical protein [Candidatus Saccharimonadales bacterium]
MSRKLTALLLAMLILVGAMGLKTVVAAHSNGTVMMANGGGPFPPVQNGGGPFPPVQNGGGPFPPVQNGGGPFPPAGAQ